MRNESNILPVIGIVLFACSVNLSNVLGALNISLHPETTRIVPLVRSAFCLAVALVLALYFKWRQETQKSAPPADELSSPQSKRLIFFPLLLISGGLLYLKTTYEMGPESVGSITSFLSLSAVAALNWAIGICLFFQVVQPQRQGFIFALSIIAGEMTWLTLVPLVEMAQAFPVSYPPLLHLYKVEGVLQLAMALCFALALLMNRQSLRLPHEVNSPFEPFFHGSLPAVNGVPIRTAARIQVKPDAPSRSERTALTLFFIAAICFSILYGLECYMMGTLPVRRGSIPMTLHLVVMAGISLVGALIDRATSGKSRGLHTLVSIFIVAALLSWLLALAQDKDLNAPFFGLLNFMRHAIQLLLYIAAARFAGNSPFFPVIAAGVYVVFVLPQLGRIAGEALTDIPYAIMGGGFLLLAVFAFSLIRALIRLGPGPLPPGPQVQQPPDEEAPLAPLPLNRFLPEGLAALRELSDAGQIAFAVAFSLTKRESEVLAHVLRAHDTAFMAREMGVSEKTVKFHLSGLLKKTGMANRQRLLYFYAAWRPE